MVGERRCSGKEFHVLGAATRKLRLPNSVLVDGTHRSPRCAERSLTLPPTSVSGVQMPQKYEGQVPRISISNTGNDVESFHILWPGSLKEHFERSLCPSYRYSLYRVFLQLLLQFCQPDKAAGVKTKQIVKQRLQRLLIRCSSCWGRRPHYHAAGLWTCVETGAVSLVSWVTKWGNFTKVNYYYYYYYYYILSTAHTVLTAVYPAKPGFLCIAWSFIINK